MPGEYYCDGAPVCDRHGITRIANCDIFRPVQHSVSSTQDMTIQAFCNFPRLAVILLAVFCTSSAAAEPQAAHSSMSFALIRDFAYFADASYKSAAAVRESRLPGNYKLTHYGNIPELEVSYFLASDELGSNQVIAVRGTANIENALVDIALKLTPDKHAGVRLHNGFSQAAQAIYTELQPWLKKNYVIHTTGHSLGGAVAVILAMYLHVDNFQLGQVITFGQPKVTNIAGASRFQELNITRVVTEKDLVPLVPPLDPVDINNIDIYWHAGREIILFTDNTYALLDGLNSMIRATKFTQEPLTENNLSHHQMTLYMKRVENKVGSSKRVPFNNSLNLFNLFGSE